MQLDEGHIMQVIQSSLRKAPEAMLEECLDILIKISGASGGSILGEEGPHLKFLFSDVEALIGMNVPWESIAGATASSGVIIYTYAPSDKRHFDGIDGKIAHQTRYLLSIPVPSVHKGAEEGDNANSAGALQLLFDENIFPTFDVSAGPMEFALDTLKEQAVYSEGLQGVFWILPNISFGLEVMKLRQTSYQAIHELKNKLISASSWINCLKEDMEDVEPSVLEDEDILEDLNLAETSIAEGANLAKSYLQFTKLYTPAFLDAQIHDVLEETASSIRALAADMADGDFAVVVEPDKAMPTRQLDPSQLKMAFFNLGKNAVEALVELGTEAPQITISTLWEDPICRVTVADNGPGLPPEIADNLFVAFKTKKEGGTGLGLTITKKIVDVHGGSIRCETGSDGTRFIIEL
ncbi:MAG: HAMP domain-containing histidine kinase [Lentisphaerae bacterium]|jgi:signal transduction histidine kinase|nr:HAMP domain-containing histidine kinase [Lentisphaerota bacterium]MBT4816910.1 HAMP domain-containing histidine kinase [Lentisphaerota bacterium]MBT5608300.1 HAMP domain-containing histidine kinase [Lentisphaerota bacterium]MBT7061800.1 HAMP domain-containing histidine kinase [Lentisphaerota bacterium]MBT7846109.1 HAMP domain-containing histidine kinase [Lentisphaerota bacterium]